MGETLDTGATFSTVTEMQAEVEKDQQAYEEIESLEDSHIVSFPELRIGGSRGGAPGARPPICLAS